MTETIALKKGVLFFLFVVSLLISGCSISALAGSTPIPTFFIAPSQANQPSGTPTYFLPDPPVATSIPPTSTPTETLTPIPTETPLPSPTPTWSTIASGEAKVPILLYHHVSDATPANRYFVTIKNFRAQMEKLKDLGYTSISISKLVDVLENGGMLPAYPVVISFDDGNSDIYDNAFPIMKEMNFTGVTFIVANRLESPGFVDTAKLKDLAAAGWEIGSHSETHVDLTQDHDIVRYEELQSRLDLEEAIGVPVKTFAYPFGTIDSYVCQGVQDYGYKAAVGLGTSNDHTWGTLYYLNRREVQGDFNLDQFLSLLSLPEAQDATPTTSP
jgi:peptidoglycan/xylan/chitin deacetylase (PgdA/CDA1 family)